MSYADKERKFNILVGQTLTKVEDRGDEIRFTTNDGKIYRQVYYADCCAGCSVEEIHGDLQDLIGVPILMAEEVTNREPDADIQYKRDKEKSIALANKEYYYEEDSETWTFYKLATIKGSVTIRWYGSSNGYYSEAPTFEEL